MKSVSQRSQPKRKAAETLKLNVPSIIGEITVKDASNRQSLKHAMCIRPRFGTVYTPPLSAR